jgi:hypothetical protein
MKVQVVQIQLSDLDSSSSNKSDRLPLHDQKSTKKWVLSSKV